MKAFRAWHLPPAFTITGDEIVELEAGAVNRRWGWAPDLETGQMPPVRWAALQGPGLRELMALLRAEGRKVLASVPLARIVEAVDRVASRFLDSGDALRVEALDRLGSFAGYSPPMASEILDGMARGWLQEGLWDLVRSDFPDPGVLDGFRPGVAGDATRAMGYPLAFHLGAGTVPGVATTSMIRSLLVKSAIVLKPGLGDIPLPVLFARGLEEADPELARCVAVIYWPVGERSRTETALQEADLVVAYGSDETIRWVRGQVPSQTPVRGYRHRMGFGLIGKEALGRTDPGGYDPPFEPSGQRTASAAAKAVALFDQKGCVSPHVFFVETGGGVSPKEWAALLAQELERLEGELPSGGMSLESGAVLQQLRGAAELLAVSGEGAVHHGGKVGPWTVLFLPGQGPEPSCMNRVVRVIPVDRMQAAVQALSGWAAFLQTVGAAGLGSAAPEIVEGLSRLGVSRVTSLENTPWPRPWWHHDGGGPLRDLVRWTDLEAGENLSSDIFEG